MTQKLKYNEWCLSREILRRVRQEDEVEHSRLPHNPPPVTNGEFPGAKIWQDTARFVFLRQMLP